MPTLICYDISNNSLRTRIGRKILEYGLDRINKSVYLGPIKKPQLDALEQLLAAMLAKKPDPNDSLIVLSVNAQQVQEMRVYGRNDLDKGELSGEKSTIIY
jgi:CRISPR-associated endonuclease Cas2